MRLSLPPNDYDVTHEIERNRELEAEDLMNRKKRQDVEIALPERLILASPNGNRYSITVSNAGSIVVTQI